MLTLDGVVVGQVGADPDHLKGVTRLLGVDQRGQEVDGGPAVSVCRRHQAQGVVPSRQDPVVILIRRHLERPPGQPPRCLQVT